MGGGVVCQTMGRISDIPKSSPLSSSLFLSLRILTVLAMMVRPLPALRVSMLVYLGSAPASSIPLKLSLSFFSFGRFFLRTENIERLILQVGAHLSQRDHVFFFL
jgi:hypothetical protein